MITHRLLQRLVLGFVFLFPHISSSQANWWKDAVFYEVFVRSFYDSNGDGKGDINGLIEKLDYLNDGNPSTQTDLGVTALWLMPIMPSPSYHGYDVTDYYGVESDYGNRQAFKNLIDSAHARGIKVIIDLVMNHSSSSHPWFQSALGSVNSPFRDYYIWEDSNPGFTGPWGQTVWHPRNGKWNYGIFWNEMPDLNYRNTSVQTEMKTVARFWTDSMHVDGFRLDAIQYLVEDGTQLAGTPETFAYIEDWSSNFKSVHPEVMTVGEIWSPTAVGVPYVQDGRLDMCFEFDLAESIISSLLANSPNTFQNMMNTVNSSFPESRYGTFLTNHDINRSFDQLGQNTNKAKLAAAVYLTLPGTPFIYYGEEIGMTGTGNDETKRKPMQWSNLANAGFSWGTPWEPLASNYNLVNVAVQQQDNTSLWHTYQQFISIRKENTALRKGAYKVMADVNTELIGYARYTNDELLLVIHNFTGNDVSNAAFALGTTNLPEGNYAVIDLLHPEDQLATVTLGAGGNITNYEPGVEIEAYGTRILSVQIAPGFNTISANELIRIYPNPTSDILHIQSTQSKKLELILLFDTQGKLLLSSKQSNFSVKSLPAGKYIVQVKFEHEQTLVSTFIRE